jgi:hypothetical protein
MRSTTDFLGLVAYLTVMYGRLPDRDLLNAAFMGTGLPQQPAAAPRLRLVEPVAAAVQDEPQDASPAAA